MLTYVDGLHVLDDCHYDSNVGGAEGFVGHFDMVVRLFDGKLLLANYEVSD